MYRANSTAGKSFTLNILSGSFIIYSLKRAISGLIFILLLVFYYSTKITFGVLLALLYKRPVSIDGEISRFIKALRLRQLRVKLISQVVKESSDPLFPGERRLISLQYSEMLSISLRFHCLSPRHVLHGVKSCETFTKHPRSARGNFIPILKITRDELPME